MIPAAFFVPMLHEFIKARVSTRLGDGTPRKYGFLTLNPFKYFEPIGFFLIMAYGVGWGQPVPTSPFGYKDKRKGIAFTYTIPILVILLLGVLTAVLLSAMRAPLVEWSREFGGFSSTFMSFSTTYAFPELVDVTRLVSPRERPYLLSLSRVITLTTDAPFSFYFMLVVNQMLLHFARFSISLALFNLIPIFPLAMNKLLHLFISPEASMKLNQNEKMLQILLIFLLIFGILQAVIFPIRDFIIRMVSF